MKDPLEADLKVAMIITEYIKNLKMRLPLTEVIDQVKQLQNQG
eukprot:CAMPEP_0170548180 /NCGR_PEP_ID=MMETSP0211-20121228/6506_1 /TAXON_ID=311385 /ORGANISM="Pseudokeronopsis sp., Strain OXSARD2" /LENGTH=42 /DNA_ID= /DNA_START= /DNA_END= /DNA_ORIENTATION=